jgi:hypothetical protein
MVRMRMVAVVASAMLGGAGCGGDVGTESDTDGMGMSMEEAAFVSACNEARGALFRMGQMAKGAQPIDESDVGTGAGFLRRLAENRQAPAEMFGHIDEWRAAVVARSQEITSLQPRIENGRFVEPDTKDMDRRMFERAKPRAIALVPWVRDVCGELDDPFD